MVPETQAGTVRLWPSAVIVTDDVRLSDLCELRGFALELEERLSKLVVATAPPQGGTRIIHMELIRTALFNGGVNMADLTLRGAVQCEVSRPGLASGPADQEVSIQIPQDPIRRVPGSAVDSATGAELNGNSRFSDVLPASDCKTLRSAVLDHFNAEMARFGGTAEVRFDQTSESVLDLTNPPYSFRVLGRHGASLGLTSLEVEVLANDRTVQTVSLVLRVALVRPAVVARRSIGQDATLRESDVTRTSMSFARLDHIGLDDVAMAIGQRAKRFIPAGTLIEPDMLESVPLVNRGELVTLASVVGGIRVITTAKATEPGLLGEIVKVRALNRKGDEFDAVVIGPAEVQIGQAVEPGSPVALAWGETE